MDLRRIVKLASCLALSGFAAVVTMPGVALLVSTYADVTATYSAPTSPDDHIDALRNFTIGGGIVLLGLTLLAVALKYWPYQLPRRRSSPPHRIGF